MLKRKQRLTTSIVVLVLGVVSGLISGHASADDKALLQGEWVLVKLVLAGEPGGSVEDYEKLEQELRIEFVGNELRLSGTLLNGEQEVSHFNLDATKDPKWIDLLSQQGGQIDRMSGIYKLDGNKLMMAFSARLELGRPTAFESNADGNSPNSILIELRRAEPVP